VSTLGEFADFEMGQAPPGSECNFDQEGTVFVKAGEFGSVYPIEREWTTKPLKFGRAGDVFICVVGATAGKLNLGIDCAIGRSVAAIRPKAELDTKFLYYQLQPWVLKLRASSSGSAQGVISKKQLADLPFDCPDLAAQNEIVAELEKQFSRLDEAVANLQRVKANLKRYKASVLKAAVEGRLVETEAALTRREGRTYETGEQLLQRIFEERRATWNGKGKYKEPAPVSAGNFSNLAAGWTYVNGGQLFRWSSGVNLPVKNLSGGDVPVYGGNGINGWHTESNISHPTLVIGRVGAGCGNVHLVLRNAWITDNAIYATEVPVSCDLRYLEIVFITANLNSIAAGSGQPFVNQTILNDTLVPLPPHEEQVRIVAEVDRHLSIIREVEAEVDTNLQRAQALRQATLAKAFSQS
jgi:type I restriction enzyme, S subunit